MGLIPEPEEESPSSTSDLCYEPLKSFHELISYGEKSEMSKSLTEAIGDSLSLEIPKIPTAPCPDKTVPLNSNFSNIKMRFDGKRLNEIECPKTLVCHDFKGGYVDDRFVDGSSNPENYIFRHWLQTDIFVYFSHYFITIPPLCWINAAHAHGVKVLGTIITEWDDGVKLCNEILKDSETIDKVVEKLCLITQDYGFEGYLVNIENELKPEQVPLMLEFLEKLTKSMKSLSKNNLTIWYDSVTIEGSLKWQDCLNEMNMKFFKACDGIYLNYNWNDEKLQKTVELAGNRKFDVYVGIDIFGRGCFGGGGLNTIQAVEKIFPYNLSYAIFAPGWSFECHPYNHFQKVDDEVWMPCTNYFYFRCLKDEYLRSARLELLSPVAETSNKKFKVYFSTDFSRGYGTKSFFFGKDPEEKTWFNLSRQSFQPCLQLKTFTQEDSSDQKLYYDTTTGFSGGGSLRLNNSKKRLDYEHSIKLSPIWFPLDIPLTSSRVSIAVLAAWKSASVHHQLEIYLEVTQEDDKTKKILLGSVDHLATSVAGKFYIHLKLSHFLQDNLPSFNKQEDVEFFFRKNNYDEKEVHGWRISCFLFDIDQNQVKNSKYRGINSLRVGAKGDVTLGYISLGQIIHYNMD